VKDKDTEQAYPIFKININDPETVLAPLLNNPEFSDVNAFEAQTLREFTRYLDNDTASMYGYASILNHWHQTTRFCTRCGSGLAQKEGGVIQQCTNDDCRHIEFPRINSAVIMRVTHGDKILLARQETWPEGRYCVLAGFVDVVETLESAVQREVMEEVNVPVENINYHSCQPWPFPNSLMLGYTAEASATEFELEQDDIAEAMWLTADELIEKMQQGTVMPPPNLSISYTLINDWFVEKTGTQLSEYQPEVSWQS
jgi:NAD+ diphosphatase